MNIYTQCCSLILLIIMLGEMMEVTEAYRPYKRYRRKPPRRPRWHSLPRSSKNYRSKRYPPKEYQRPTRYRYDPVEEDIDHPPENRPYTIVIQLPKKDDKYNPRTYHRTYEREESLPLYDRDDDDYIEEEEDLDDRTFQVDNKKKVRIKLHKGENPQLHIKISRIDTANDIEIVDKSNLTSMEIPLQPKSYTNLTLSMGHSEEEEIDWLSTDQPITMDQMESI